uniref:ATP synthase complex subunit 8 n=1 Tax=Linoclostis gonatias TaxID=2746747 RepID=A0A7D4XP32_9NEOP|nr:ATP synthase F0 subunit 8 [Linoclostis gonatias]
MPQMMPINWVISFIFFIMMFFIFNIMNYYIFNINFNKSISSHKKILKNNHLIWKW